MFGECVIQLEAELYVEAMHLRARGMFAGPPDSAIILQKFRTYAPKASDFKSGAARCRS